MELRKYFLVLSLICVQSFAQTTVKLVDTLVIKGISDYYIHLAGDTLHAVEWNDGKVTRMNLQGEVIDSFRLGGKFDKGADYHMQINGLQENPCGYTIYTHNGNRLYFTDEAGAIRKKVRLKAKLDGYTYRVAPYHLTDALRYVKHMDAYLLPIEMIAPREKGNAAYGPADNPGYRTFYKEGGLVGLFSASGKLLHVYGEWDPIFQEREFLTYYAKTYYAYDAKKQLLYIGNGATENVQIWNLDGQQVGSFKLPSAVFQESVDYPVITSLAEYNKYRFHYVLETPSAHAFQVYPERGLAFRSYRPAVEDTCVMDANFDKKYAEYDSLRQHSKVYPKLLSTFEAQLQQELDKPKWNYVYRLDAEHKVLDASVIAGSEDRFFVPVGFTREGLLLRWHRIDVAGEVYVLGVYRVE